MTLTPIFQPHVVAVPLNVPERHAPPPADFLCEPIPVFPSRHPFHPDLQHYIDSSPHTRVKWLIPIHGPVDLVDLPEDEALAGFRPSWGHLALSEAEYRDVRKQHRQTSSSTTGSNGASTKSSARPLVWTQDSLGETWNMLLKMRKLGRLGPIALALASSEPDPFRPAARQSSYALHHHKCTTFRPVDSVHSDTRPVRPEIGDHIKLFCDLRFAMAVRQALKYLALGDENTPLSRPTTGVGITAADAPSIPMHMRQKLGPTLSSATSTSSKPGATHLPFRGAKLCLVGDRGEVLIVL
jgi:hypothetical protein